MNELAREAVEAEKWSLNNPGEEARQAYVTTKLEGAPGPVVAVSDYMRAVPLQIAHWVPEDYHVLGTDGFGFADTRPAARRFFQVDAESVVVETLRALAQRGEVKPEVVAEAFGKYRIDDPDGRRRRGAGGRRRLTRRTPHEAPSPARGRGLGAFRSWDLSPGTRGSVTCWPNVQPKRCRFPGCPGIRTASAGDAAGAAAGELGDGLKGGLAGLGAVGGLDGAVAEQGAPAPAVVRRGLGRPDEVADQLHEAVGVVLVREVAAVGDDLDDRARAIRAAFSACSAGMTWSSVPHTTSIGIAWVR